MRPPRTRARRRRLGRRPASLGHFPPGIVEHPLNLLVRRFFHPVRKLGLQQILKALAMAEVAFCRSTDIDTQYTKTTNNHWNVGSSGSHANHLLGHLRGNELDDLLRYGGTRVNR